MNNGIFKKKMHTKFSLVFLIIEFLITKKVEIIHQNCNSKLSPYIRFGMISVNRIWYILNDLKFDKNVEHYKSEIGWREFSYYLLYHYPNMEYKNLQAKFDNFEWENSNEKLLAWKKGKTGFPIIDAGMRELWQTGFMHNRIRMVVASFLVKNLSIDWRLGEAWFWDCLLDADYASNIAGWQWVAGTGLMRLPILEYSTQSCKVKSLMRMVSIHLNIYLN